MPNPPTEIAPDTLVTAALAGEPYDLPVGYGHLAHKIGRREVVPNRIAKNIGPLLGVPDRDGPFGEMSWLCDFRQLTLGEIARGAPEPTRAELNELRAGHVTAPSGWQLVGRAVYGKAPNTIVNATLNKFSPDTKSGATLTGLNRLLEPQTQTLTEAITSDMFQGLSVDQQLRAYGAMIFGAYRPQPLFFHAGLFARGIQRALKQDPELPISPHLESAEFARCELSATQPDSASNVFDLDIIDETAESLAGTLIGPHRRTKNQSPKNLADYMSTTIRQLYGLSWQEKYRPSTGQRTIRCFENPTEVSARFAADVLPYITHRII